jgi:hypothetical protein
METTLKQRIIDAINGLGKKEFKTVEVLDALPTYNRASIKACIYRDLTSDGIIEIASKDGRENIFRIVPPGTKDLSTQPPRDASSYDEIGRAIEALIELKNKQIKQLTDQNVELKKENIDKDAAIQERDRHIHEQGRKIHALNENQRGGSIKLDELQDLVKGK